MILMDIYSFISGIFEWIMANLPLFISMVSLIVTLILAISSLTTTRTNLKTLQLSSQPTIKINIEEISLHPEIELDKDNKPIVKEKERYFLNIISSLDNISSNAAQNLTIDGIVKFKVKKPLNMDSLPVHLPEHKDFLTKDNFIKVTVSFNGYIAREIIKDYLEGRKNKLSPFLPKAGDKDNKLYWDSPLLIIKVFYYDIQGQEYVSERECFFHCWENKKTKKLEISLVNPEMRGFTKVRQLKENYIKKYLDNNRHKRYCSFNGEKYRKNDTVFLFKFRSK